MLDLLDFVYTEDGAQGVPDLRRMVLVYVAAKMTDMRESERLRDMMREVRGMSADFLEALLGA